MGGATATCEDSAAGTANVHRNNSSRGEGRVASKREKTTKSEGGSEGGNKEGRKEGSKGGSKEGRKEGGGGREIGSKGGNKGGR